MNKEQQQIIDEAYENYVKQNDDTVGRCDLWTLKKEEFINNCKIDSVFSNKWGIKIEERELTRDERIDLYCKEHTPGIRGKYEPPFDNFIDAKLTTRNISTKLITLTYNNETIESYK